jgi:group I intron endonuclease
MGDKHFLYKISCVLDGMIYIGRTFSPENRWKQHKANSLAENPPLYINRSMALNGIENYTFEVIATCRSTDDALVLEKLLIIQFDSINPEKGYNRTLGTGSGSMSDAAKQNMSDAHKGNKLSSITKQKIAAVHIGRKASDETKRKMSNLRKGENGYMFGRTHSDKTKAIWSKNRKGKKFTDQTKERMSKSAKHGETHPAAKLTEEKVIAIRADKQSNKDVAKHYNISPTLVSNIRLRKCWKHI